MKNLAYAGLALVALAFLSAFYAYPQMPSQMASHWNLQGNVDGYMAKDAALFFVPVLILFLWVLFLYLPKLDPLRDNYQHFMKEYQIMCFLIVAFMFYAYLLTLAFNLGFTGNLVQFLSPAFGVLFLYLGVVVGKAKKNWFVGIRTPWTLSSETVWDKTHARTAKLFTAAGIASFLGLLFPEVGLTLSIALLIAAAVYGVVYSYLEFQREQKRKKGPSAPPKRLSARKSKR